MFWTTNYSPGPRPFFFGSPNRGAPAGTSASAVNTIARNCATLSPMSLRPLLCSRARDKHGSPRGLRPGRSRAASLEQSDARGLARPASGRRESAEEAHEAIRNRTAGALRMNAGEQSSRNWGWIRKQGRDPRELPAIILALRLWEDIARELGENIGWTRGGIAYVAETDAELARFESWLPHAREHQLDTRLLSSVETDALLRQGKTRFKGALFTPSDARAD